MITPEQAAILEYLSSCPKHTTSFADLVSRFDPDAAMRINRMVSIRLLDVHTDHSRPVSLTGKGLEELDAYRSVLEQQRRQRAEHEQDERLKNALEDKRRSKDARRSWVQWAITTILTILSFFAGAITEKLTGFMQWISAFFH